MPIPRDYRLIKNPKLTMLTILDAVSKYNSFTSPLVSKEFNISLAEACTRLSTLRRYGLITRNAKTKPYSYRISKWGYRYLKDKTHGKT